MKANITIAPDNIESIIQGCTLKSTEIAVTPPRITKRDASRTRKRSWRSKTSRKPPVGLAIKLAIKEGSQIAA